jgi:parvulin-like peptidyl-prolyl isomerase/glutaredoxin
MVKKNKQNNNEKEEIVVKKSTLMTIAAILLIILVLIVSWGRIDKLIRNTTLKTNNIIAEVNGEEITMDELDKSYDFFFFITGYPEQFKQMLPKENFLDQVIAEKLLLQEVNKQGIELTEEEFDQLKEQTFGETNLSEEELKSLLQEKNIEYDYFLGYYKKQILITKLLNATIVKDIKVDEKEIEDYYEANKNDFENQTLNEVKDSVKALLLSLKQREALKNFIEELKSDSEIQIYLGESKTAAKTTALSDDVSDECIKKYSLKGDAIVFYHADWCPHCTKMKSIVEELENEGFEFYWAEVDDKEAAAVIGNCFKDVVEKGVPEFICAGTKEMKMGEISKTALKSFAEKCRSNI